MSATRQRGPFSRVDPIMSRWGLKDSAKGGKGGRISRVDPIMSRWGLKGLTSIRMSARVGLC